MYSDPTGHVAILENKEQEQFARIQHALSSDSAAEQYLRGRRAKYDAIQSSLVYPDGTFGYTKKMLDTHLDDLGITKNTIPYKVAVAILYDDSLEPEQGGQDSYAYARETTYLTLLFQMTGNKARQSIKELVQMLMRHFLLFRRRDLFEIRL